MSSTPTEPDRPRARTAASRARLRGSPAIRSEVLALLLGVAGALAGIGIGASLLTGTRPLSGDPSIGQAAAIASFVVAVPIAAAVLLLLTRRREPWLQSVPRWRLIADVAVLSLVHGLLAFFLVSGAFLVFQTAFVGVALDRVAGTFWVAISSAATAYVVASSAQALTTRSLASLLAVFVIVGVLSAAMVSPDPFWWERYFSVLGAQSDQSGLRFNITLLLTGIALVTVSEGVAHDLRVWAEHMGESRWRVQVVHAALATIGVLVAAVALIPMNVNRTAHDVAAKSLVVVFGLILLTFPVLLHRLPGGLRALTTVALGLLITLIVLYEGLDYLNMTAFEMGASITTYAWLLLFVRTVNAAADGVRSLPASTGAPT